MTTSAPTRHIFTTQWALQRMPSENEQDRVEQTALAHMIDAYRRFRRDPWRLPTDLPHWDLWADNALEHARDVHDAHGWTQRRISDTVDWLMGCVREIEREEAP